MSIKWHQHAEKGDSTQQQHTATAHSSSTQYRHR